MSIDWVSRADALTFRVRNFVDGRWAEQAGGERLDKCSPRDGRLLCRFGAGEKQDAANAVRSARRAFDDGRWSDLSVQRRKEILYRLASLIETHCEELALLECLDVGKPISDALNCDVPAAAASIRFSAEAADKFYGRVYGNDRSNLSYQLRKPVGVVAGIVGWNFPVVLAAAKIGPVLATGNCLVLKPSELTSFSAGRIAQLAVEAGVPEGVFNVVHGNDCIGTALSHDHCVDLITFTGSTNTGKQLLIASGQSNMKRLILECGGKCPAIVFDDFPHLDSVAEYVVQHAFWNQGQVCTAGSRLLVQETIKDELLRLVIEKTEALRFGDPLSARTKFGALVSQIHQQKILRYIEAAEREGAEKVYQLTDAPPFEGGFYVPPVIFNNVMPDQKIAQEEIFGPVLSVIGFRDEEQAVRIANNTVYGLAAVLWTKDLDRARRITDGVKAGWIVVNATAAPCGGPDANVLSIGGHKESGIGTEGGLEGLEEYTSKSVVQVFV